MQDTPHSDTLRIIPEHISRLLLIGGALLLLLAYAVPMFPRRITQATTRFTGGTLIVAHYPLFIYRQHYRQASPPLREELQSVDIRLAPTEHNGSAWAWLVQLIGAGSSGLQYASFVVCLALPVLASLIALGLGTAALVGQDLLAQRLIVATVRLSLLAFPALWLAWLHQFDFSSALWAKAPAALAPRAGFWLALFGIALMIGGSFSLRRQAGSRLANWWALVLAVAVGLWLLVRFKPYPFLEIWDFIYDGILVTLRIVTTSFGFILLVSLFGGLGRISRSKIIYSLASLYVEIIRGIPLLVQLLFIWFALPQVFDVIGNLLLSLSPWLTNVGQWLIDLRLSPFTAAVIGLTICYGAYGSEIFRAGISSIHHGQMEAARSLGMSYIQAMRYIILPQAIRVILPPIGNEFVALLKDSSLVSVLAVSDLTRRGREYMARTFLSFDTWIMVALCYLVLTLFSSRAVEFIESKSRFEG
ncbi:MAG: amino acid ABC transporter permease [Chloroflexi bacterium]|nr:amino acid ABC transporter permease [Chloroflexota bacterium]